MLCLCASLLLTRWRCPLFPTPPPAVPSLFLSQGTVEKQQSLFFMISVTEEMARDGLVLRCMSTNKSRFKLVVSHYFSSNIVQVHSQPVLVSNFFFVFLIVIFAPSIGAQQNTT